jgi:hypothetical protein
MPTKFGRRQHERNPVPTGTLNNRVGDVSYQVSRFAVSEAIPMVKKRVKATLHANPRPVSYYQKLPVGQRCSCWGLGDTPQAFCASCFGTGFVIGYEKYGCATHMLDATSELSLVNVVPNRKLAMAPIPLALIDKALRGSVEMAVRLQANVGVLDCWQVYQSTPPGTAITLLVRTPTETAWTPATEAEVQARLHGGVLLIRAELTRQSLTTDKPYLRAIRLRYQLRSGDTRVLTNTPIGEDMLSVQEFGIVETFTALSFIFDDTLKLISPLDFMYDARTDRKWIVQSARNQNPYGYTLFWHVQARLAQPFDTINEFPLGVVIPPPPPPPTTPNPKWGAWDR